MHFSRRQSIRHDWEHANMELSSPHVVQTAMACDCASSSLNPIPAAEAISLIPTVEDQLLKQAFAFQEARVCRYGTEA